MQPIHIYFAISKIYPKKPLNMGLIIENVAHSNLKIENLKFNFS